jgi:iron complex transport system substrate-binding protein
MSAKIDAVSAKTAGLSQEQKPRVLYIVWFQPIWTMGGNTFVSDMVTTAGGTNIYASAFEGSRTVSLESVVAANPQIIIASGMGTSGDATLNSVKSEDRLKSVDARVNNRVYKVDNPNLTERPGPRITEGLQVLAHIIHPELFPGK